MTLSGPRGTVVVFSPDRPARSLVTRALRDGMRRMDIGTLSSVLDSLGFFSARWDTSSSDTARLTLNRRWAVDTIAIHSPHPLPLDSIGGITIPFPYDAGVINRISERTVYAYACRGFPFAELAVSVVRESDSADSSAASGGNVRVVFDVRVDQQAVFANPSLQGTVTTRPRTLAHDIRIKQGSSFDVRIVAATLDRLQSRSYVAEAAAGPPLIDRAAPARDSGGMKPVKVIVPFTIRERSGLGLDGVLGFRSDEVEKALFTGDLNLSVLNTLGFGEQGSIAYRADATIQRLDISAGLPWIFSSNLHLFAGFGLEVKKNQYGFIRGEARVLTEIRPRLQAGAGLKATANETEGRQYVGGAILLSRIAEPLGRGIHSRELDVAVGTGVAKSDNQYQSRWNFGFRGGMHAPVWRSLAVHLRLVSDNLISREDSIPAVELYRVGGYGSVRGYPDYQYALRSVTYAQAEILAYLAQNSSVYILCDGGVGFSHRIGVSSGDRVDLLGYGLGMRFTTRLGMLSVEWARNVQDVRGLGRVHVRFQSPLAMDTRL